MLQLFKNWSSMGPSYGVQSFRNRLLQSGITSPARKPALAWGPLSMCPQVLSAACFGAVSPWGHKLPSGIHLLRHGVPSMDYRWIPAPPWTSMGCRGTTCFTMAFITSCKGRLSAPASWAPPFPSFFTDLGVLHSCFFHIISLLSLFTAISPQVFFFPSEICYPRGATTVADWDGLGQQWVCLRASWHCLYQTWGKLLAASPRSDPYSPLAIFVTNITN